MPLALSTPALRKNSVSRDSPDWRLLLFQQFHDILPGSSIAWVHQDAEQILGAVEAEVEGRIAGLAIAHSLGYLNESEFSSQRDEQLKSMVGLRSGSHGEVRAKAKEYLSAMMEEQ